MDLEWIEFGTLTDLTQHVRTPTYKRDTKGNVLDLCLTTPRVVTHSCEVLQRAANPVFDHYPVVTKIQSVKILPKKLMTRYKETDESWAKYQERIFHIPVKRIIASPPTTKEEFEAVCVELNDSVMSIYKDTTPTYTVKVHERNPWLTRQVKREINSLRTLNSNAQSERCARKRKSMFQRLKIHRQRTPKKNCQKLQERFQVFLQDARWLQATNT